MSSSKKNEEIVMPTSSDENANPFESAASELSSGILQAAYSQSALDHDNVSKGLETNSSSTPMISSPVTAALQDSSIDRDTSVHSSFATDDMTTPFMASCTTSESIDTLSSFHTAAEDLCDTATDTELVTHFAIPSAPVDISDERQVLNSSTAWVERFDDNVNDLADSVSSLDVNTTKDVRDAIVLPFVDVPQITSICDPSLDGMPLSLPTASESHVPEAVSEPDSLLSTVNSSLGDYQSATSSVSPNFVPSYRNASTSITEIPQISTSTQLDENIGIDSPRATICSKHQASVIAAGNTPIVMNETPDLCLSCSKSMLSYIMLIQKFLEGLATDICKQIDPMTQCYQCVKERLELPNQTSHTCKKSSEDNLKTSPNIETNQQAHIKRQNQFSSSSKIRNLQGTAETYSERSAKDSADHISKYAESTPRTSPQNFAQRPQTVAEQSSETSQVLAHNSNDINVSRTLENVSFQRDNVKDFKSNDLNSNQAQNQASSDVRYTTPSVLRQQESTAHSSKVQPFSNVQQYQNFATSSGQEKQQQQYFLAQTETQTVDDLRTQPYSSTDDTQPMHLQATHVDHGLNDSLSTDSFQGLPSPQFPHGEGIDGILSTLYKVERGFRDMAKGPTVWERLAAFQQNNQPPERNNNEAFVTIARNKAEVLGSLVLGASLLLCGTSKTLCVLVTDNVNTDFMAPLSSVFHVVMHVRSLDSVGTTKLSLLDQPELGICFSKLNVWRLEQFMKCVYLNPDTVVVQNSDELFCREELSAVPDIGWPDCFNSGVFVFKPSMKTFWELLEYAENQRSFDGGEQGLLNIYFNSWSHDIHKKLSFIYNLMANVSYTYTPAFKQFGRTVKIVQFLGPFKPWHVKFYSGSGQIAHSSAVHPTYVQFVHVWINVFRVSVLPLFSPEIQSFVSSQNTLSAYELLRYFPSIESETEFLLNPPSVRLRPTIHSPQPGLPPSVAIEKLQLPATPPVSGIQNVLESSEEMVVAEKQTVDEGVVLEESEPTELNPPELKSMEDSELLDGSVEGKEPAKPKSLIPGAEVGDYQGMSAWEQGRMDYEGAASSDTIIDRLRYLMGKPERLV